MRHLPIDPSLFVQNRQRLAARLLPQSAAIVNANDVLPINSDATLIMQPNSDLFYLTGIEQEQTILVLWPDAPEEKFREVLFLREPTDHIETWEGHKLTKDEAIKISGIKTVKWLSEWPGFFHGLMCDVQNVYLNANEHKRATIEVQTRDARFIAECLARYPLHHYHRLAPLMHQLRVVKSEMELDLLRKAVEITGKGFERVVRFVKPGVSEHEVEAEFVHEFTRNRGKFAYSPIIASGNNARVMHYITNDQPCKKGELLLMDVAASYANYNADLTRTIPVSGKFTLRQKQVYNAVLRVLKATTKNATVGTIHRDWQKQAQADMTEELLALGLLKRADVKKQTPDEPACRKYFMHGVGHVLGLDVHDVGPMNEPFAPGWVLTVEPGIYIPDEGFSVRLENDILVTENGPVNLMANIPIEAEEIEDLMNRR